MTRPRDGSGSLVVTTGRRRAALRAFVGGIAIAGAACSHPPNTTSSASSASTAPVASAPIADGPAPPSILAAEQRRHASEIKLDDQSSRDVSVRRAAARALARIATPGARAGLLRALADEDPIVVAWAAYGLGASCEIARSDTVSALAARSVSLPSEPPGQAPSALEWIARGIGRCGADESEPTLFAWLSRSPREARAAALGLVDLARQKKRLVDATIASLLNLAAGSPSTPSVPEAMVPLSVVDNVPSSVRDRLVDVGTQRLAEPSDYRLFAVRALSRGKEAAVAPLAKALVDPKMSPADRVEAARALARIGDAGRAAVAALLVKLEVDPAKVAAGGADFDVPLAMLLAIDDPKPAKDALAKLAALAAPDGASDAGKRRVSRLRCTSAKLLAGANFADAALAACDLSGGAIGSRALVDVVGAGELVGPRRAAFDKLVASADVRTREAAIRLLASHDELADASAILTKALGAKESGVAGVALEVLVSAPDRAAEGARKRAAKSDKKKPHEDKPRDKPKDADAEPPREPSKAILAALAAALDRAEKSADPELEGAVIDAYGALGRKEVGAKLEELCRSTYPSLREHAAGALGLITGKKRACPAPEVAGPDPPELVVAPPSTATLVLDTDAGELRIVLDGRLAPITTLRIADLARSGYYDGTVVDRVDPSFVVQFGSPFGDQSGGPEGRQPLRCETSPLPFDKLSVGVAIAGRDTGSSQLFVMRSRMPHLDGDYSLVGTASGPWDLVSEGDLIKHARME